MLERYRLYTGLFCGAIWVLLCYGFIRDEFLPFLGYVQSLVNVACDGIFLILGLVTIRSRRDIFMAVSLLLLALISKYLNHGGLAEWLNGMRDYIGLLFTVPFIRYMMSRKDYAVRFTRSMDKQLFVFLCIQPVCVLWQFIRYGAGDAVGGSMGFGHSGILSTLIYVISFYLITKKWDYSESYWSNLWRNRLYIFLLFPTFLNETKISFLYIIGYFFLLMTIDRKFIFRLLMATPLALVGVAILGSIYLSVTHQEAERLLSEKFYTDYFIGEDIHDLANLSILVEEEEIETDNLWVVDLPRFGRFVLLPDALNTTGGGMLLGAGPGQFKGFDFFHMSPFSRKYRWLLKGSTPLLFTWMVQLGLMGVCWVLLNLATIIFTPNSAPCAVNLRLYLCMVIGLSLFYQDFFAFAYFCAIIFYICLEGLQPMYNPQLQSDS